MYNVDLIGGDTTSSPKGMVISVTAIGQAEEKDIVYRSGANVGDIICVTGDLGVSNPGIQPDLGELDHVVGRQLKPEARHDAVAYMKGVHLKPTSMIDISDGLASELFHLCTQSNVGAYIEEGKVPIHPQTEETAIEFKVNPITCALNGGEDYELLVLMLSFTFAATAQYEELRMEDYVYVTNIKSAHISPLGNTLEPAITYLGNGVTGRATKTYGCK